MEFLTQAKLIELQEELENLKTNRRKEIAEALEYAKSLGDLSENAEYDAAKERQGFIEGRIAELESKLANAQIINPALIDADGACVFGATVELKDFGGNVTVIYQIVGDDEANLKEKKISISSPIARALIGKYAGDIVEVVAPAGVREYEILNIQYI